ncbi:MAG: thiolase family protein [Thermoleophilia bacterium]|nr:thiolase family protein [Thermoleophilia bacterium]
MTDVAIVGAGIHPFGRHDGVSALAMGAYAVRAALADAGIAWADVQFAYGGSEDGGNADTMVSELGPTGLPFVNVRNGCATGGSSLVSAVTALRSDAFEVGVVVGFDKHPRGAFQNDPADWSLPAWYGEDGLMVTTQFFGAKLQRYMHDHDIPPLTLAQVAEKAFSNGSRTPHAWRRTPLSVDEILGSRMLAHPLTQYMLCSPGEGAVALVVCRREYLERLPDARPVWLRSVAFRTRRAGTFEVFSPSLPLELAPSPSVDASRAAFEAAGVAPEEVDVVQVQDTESGAELIHLAECGLCEHGEQVDLYATGATRVDGRLPVNTDGGCLANGEPVGASGLRQVYEVVAQLRGDAGDRQVPNDPQVGFTHVYGAPGVSACAVLSR